MIMNIVNLMLALFGVGFLIFIHELGHYILAKRVGMKIEVFSIGLGKPFKVWIFQGVKWQLCYLPFGGYVKIAGEKEEKGSFVKEVADESFYGKKPIDRIKVALAGPVVNIAFAFLAFAGIWALGGRMEPFSKHTKMIGYVDPASEIFAEGVRPGDEILSYDGKVVGSFKDLLLRSVMQPSQADLGINKIDYFTGNIQQAHYKITPYMDPRISSGEFKTTGILNPASLLILQKPTSSLDFSLEESPMKNSGMNYGDRIVWAGGELVFSHAQLNRIVNEEKVLVTVERRGKTALVKIPRVKIGDLRLTKEQKGELEDWQHQLHLKKTLKECYFLPYHIDKEGVVRSTISFVDDEAKLCNVFDDPDATSFLNNGDKLIAVNGSKVRSGYEILSAFQVKKVQMIVQRDQDFASLSENNQDDKLIHAFDGNDLLKAVEQVKTLRGQNRYGSLYVLKPVEPVMLSSLSFSGEKKDWLTKESEAQQQKIDKIKNNAKRSEAQKFFDKSRQKLVLGLPLTDAMVRYNPNPFQMFVEVTKETFFTLKLLLTGQIHPKWMSGPVGMVQMIHQGWSVGVKEGMYWLAMISLNLGIFNLLPLPVLDGGHICFSLYEIISRRRLHPKVMEKLIIPFIGLLMAFFVYITYQDLKRLFMQFF